MNRLSARRFLALLLGLTLALGIGLSAVQAADMVSKIAMTSDRDATCTACCDACGIPPENASDGTCKMFCTAPVSGVLSSGLTIAFVQSSMAPIPAYGFVDGWAYSPEPDPPRTFDLS